jgi:hypothetical protein
MTEQKQPRPSLHQPRVRNLRDPSPGTTKRGARSASCVCFVHTWMRPRSACRNPRGFESPFKAQTRHQPAAGQETTGKAPAAWAHPEQHHPDVEVKAPTNQSCKPWGIHGKTSAACRSVPYLHERKFHPGMMDVVGPRHLASVDVPYALLCSSQCLLHTRLDTYAVRTSKNTSIG